MRVPTWHAIEVLLAAVIAGRRWAQRWFVVGGVVLSGAVVLLGGSVAGAFAPYDLDSNGGVAGFNDRLCNPPQIIDFDDLASGTSMDGVTIPGITFERWDNSAPIVAVRGLETVTPTGFTGAPNPEQNKLFPTSGQIVLSPGGLTLGPGPNEAVEHDDLILTFDPPVTAFGFDLLSQSADGGSLTSIAVYNPGGRLLYLAVIPISALGPAGAPGGADFWGGVASAGDSIARIKIHEGDADAVDPDGNVGFDTFRYSYDDLSACGPGPGPNLPLNCDPPGSCETIKYGLGIKPDFRRDKVPPELSYYEYGHEDFGPDLGGVSYHISRPSLGLTNGTDRNGCGPERNFSPLPGQVLLKERVGCIPTAEGPGLPGTKCRVEIPLSDGGVTPVAQTSEFFVAGHTSGVLLGSQAWVASWQGAATIGGASDSSNALCREENLRRRPTTGTRYVLPLARGGDGEKTYVRWDSSAGVADRTDQATNFRFHSDDNRWCCNSNDAIIKSGCNFILPGAAEYPVLRGETCDSGSSFRSIDDNTVTDWIFEAGRGSRFYTDPDFVVPGQLLGVCRVNRSQPCAVPLAHTTCTGPGDPFSCCTGPEAGTCGTECDALDADPDAAGIQADICDVREPGIRAQQICTRDANNEPRPDCCGVQLFRLRGTPNRGCSILPRFAIDGDPGPDCGVGNFGIDHRDDEDCDGIADQPDMCPFLSEWDQDRDSDGDCVGGVGGNCRGDECECGDANGDGRVNVSDLVVINQMIFGATAQRRLCDANNDRDCDVSDIVAANREVFAPGSSSCRQTASITCGNGVLEPHEGCDDAALCMGGPLNGEWCDASIPDDCTLEGSCERQNGDGCDNACRVEEGWTCTGDPSVCTRNR